MDTKSGFPLLFYLSLYFLIFSITYMLFYNVKNKFYLKNRVEHFSNFFESIASLASISKQTMLSVTKI